METTEIEILLAIFMCLAKLMLSYTLIRVAIDAIQNEEYILGALIMIMGIVTFALFIAFSSILIFGPY